MLDEVLKRIKPSKEEVSKVLGFSRDIIKKIKIKDARVVLGGSAAKDTWLRGFHDIDLFVKFDYGKYKEKSDRLSDVLNKELKKKFKVNRLHGSRDYFQIKKGSLVFEVIPILDITKASQARNITDVSPLHTSWVKKHKKQDEIRLTKAFARAQNVYGAETHMMGFSGYVLEILTIHYKGFMKLVKNASRWKEKTVLDTERLLKDPLKELNKSKIKGPLVLVDPVDKTRNAAASLSKENYERFIKACKLFIKNPSEKFFMRKLEEIPSSSLVVEFSFRKGKKDVVGGKYYSLFKKLKKQLELHDFKPVNSGFILEDKAVLWYKLKKAKLPDKIEVKGPPLKEEIHVKRFEKKHKKTFFRKGFIYAKEKRKYAKAEKLLKDFLKGRGLR